ncbi:hypothetical protein AALB16_09900 [Lachnospiraceae bacterium 62-35]
MKNKDQRGSLTMEATIIIVIFIFGYVAISSVVSFIRAQAIIQYSISQAARDISTYCYIISKTGLMGDSAALGEEAASAKADADKVIGSVVKLYQAMDSGADSVSGAFDEIPFDGDWQASIDGVGNLQNVTQEEFQNITNASNQMMEEAESYFSQPDKILKGLLSVAKDEGFKALKSYVIAAPISKALVKGQIDLYGHDSQGRDVLEKLGVVDGVDGLNFMGCTLFNDGKTITVSVVYKMKIDYPFIKTKEFMFKQTASTEAWGSKHEERPWRN